MQKTILYTATSLDGFVAGTNDDLSWLLIGEPVRIYWGADHERQGRDKNFSLRSFLKKWVNIIPGLRQRSLRGCLVEKPD